MEKRQRGKRRAEYIDDYVVFDLETTGLSPLTDKIIELSGLKVKAGKVVETFSTLVNPGRPIPYGATAINGITDDMVKDSPSIQQVLGKFLDFVGDFVLVGHNIHTFDMKFIYIAAEEGLGRAVTNDYIDTLYLARKCLPELSHHRLVDLASHFKFSTQGAHRALADCQMNQKCYEAMAKLQKAKTPRQENYRQENSPRQENVFRQEKTLSSKLICPRCKGELIKREGRYGSFYGCSNFPSCRYTKNI